MIVIGKILRVAALTALALGAALPARALIQENPGCVDNVTGRYRPNQVPNNCTANDVTFTVVGLGTQTDGCLTSSDTFSIFLRAVVQNTTAQTRYDIGLYMATDGDPNGDGALTGGCARQHLTPVGTVGQTTCPPLNLLGGAGRFLTAETGASNSTPDLCGDLFSRGNAGCDQDGNGFWDDSALVFTQPVTFPCRDLPPPAGDGFVNIPTCATWGNQANEVWGPAGNDTCESDLEIIPGTKAKCRCQDVNSNVPSPQLNLSCSCNPNQVNAGETTTCTVTYTNTRTCTPSAATAERFRCGTASYVRFKVNYSTTNGSVTSVATSGPGAGTAVNNGAGLITWTPASALGTAGVIGPNGHTGTLTYTYKVADNPPDLNVTLTTQTFWSNFPGFSPEVVQNTLTCGATLTTPVTLASARAIRRGEGAMLEWTTATEAGNVGFNLYAETADGWRKLNDEPIPSQVIDSTVPQLYRFRADELSADRFLIEEIDLHGKTRLHGPFEVGKPAGRRPSREAIDWDAVRAEAEAGARAAKGMQAAVAAAGGKQREVELLVDRDGLYRVTFDQLAAAGFDLKAPVDHLALTVGGQPVPIRVSEAKGVFGPGAYVEFFGRALDTLYTATNVYRLGVDRRLARRVADDGRPAAGAAAPFYLETSRLARRRAYSFASPGDQPWYDTRMLAFRSPRSFTFSVPVEGYQAGAAPAALAVDLWGVTVWPAIPDHHVRASLNGVPLADATFDGQVAHTLSAAIPPGVLVEGANSVVIELPGDLGVPFHLVDLARIGVTYPRAFAARGGALRFTAAGERFEVTGLPGPEAAVYRLDAAGPVRLAGTEVVAAGGGFTARFPGLPQPAEYAVAATGALLTPGLRAPRPAVDLTGGTADYLVITHPAFAGSLGPLVTLHQSAGLSVKVVNVDDVYAQFSHGVFDPAAIRAYIGHAVRAMGTRYVLLVGGDTYDYRDYLGIGSISFIPSLYAATGPIVRFAPVDPLYADVDGDDVPDTAIGRLPVRTTADIDSIVAKTVDYAGKVYGRTAVLAADAADTLAGLSFTGDSEKLAEDLGGSWTLRRAYLDWPGGLPAARDTLLAGFNDGSALTSFIGHSGPTEWTFSGLFRTPDARALTNGGRPTVVVQWGCWNNYHVEPSYNTLGHALLLSGDRGAAAVLGSATLLDTASAARFSEHFSPLVAQPGTTLGDAMLEAKRGLVSGSPKPLDVLLGWTLLGDPALVVEP